MRRQKQVHGREWLDILHQILRIAGCCSRFRLPYALLFSTLYVYGALIALLDSLLRRLKSKEK
jgi:hypothetical protein